MPTHARALTELVTPRLILRGLVPTDAASVFAYRTDPEVSRYQGWVPGSVEEVGKFIEQMDGVNPLLPGKWFQFALIARESGDVVGDCGLHPRMDDLRQVELGITLAPKSQRQGLACEAVRAVMNYLFTHTETHRVFCSVDPRNGACIRLLRKLGMRQEAHFVENVWIRGEWVDDLVFAVLRREWRG